MKVVRMSNVCKCDSCGAEFEIKLDVNRDNMLDGRGVNVTSFTCSCCGEQFIVSVEDATTVQMKSELQALQSEYRRSYGVAEDPHKLKNEIGFKKRQLFVYSNKLLKRYSKELRQHG